MAVFPYIELRSLASQHLKVAHLRRDYLHKITSYLAKNFSSIVIEDLNVKGMLANRKLAKAISELGFYEFRRQLEYKCELYGSKLTIVDRFFPSSNPHSALVLSDTKKTKKVC